ncbi:MAG: cytochrome C oxidase subunit IV family protein [Acidobacteriota bacterium]|nr:cytochrome C oxidase subunit IV family protein [Acidobacteriota bacterium]
MFSRRTYVLNGMALLILLAATAAFAKINLGPWNTPIAMAIAASKALLVILIFMEVRISPRLIWLTAAIGFFWLAILVVAVNIDVATRVAVLPR